MNVTIDGLDALVNKMHDLPAQLQDLAPAWFRVGVLVKRTAVQYAPVSPAAGLLKELSMIRMVNAGFSNKRIKRTLKAAKARRDPRATSRPKPGGLMRSIMFQAGSDYVEIYVPANSEAGKYAYKIHEEKGLTWLKRGPGTQAKGAQADDKFITRAITDNESQILSIMESEIAKKLGT